MEQLVKDQEAVDQVKQIVEKEEAIMQQETNIVENYAKVCASLCVPVSVPIIFQSALILCHYIPSTASPCVNFLTICANCVQVCVYFGFSVLNRCQFLPIF